MFTYLPCTKGTPFQRRHFQMHFREVKFCISIQIPLKFVPWGPINNIQAVVRIMARCRRGDMPPSEPMLT